MSVEVVAPAPRLELVPGTVRSAVSDGVALLTPSGLVVVRGVEVQRWLDRLLPLADGTRDADALVEGLGPQQAAHVRRLLAGLQQRGVLREVGEPPTATAPATVVGSGPLAAAVTAALRADGVDVTAEVTGADDGTVRVRSGDREAEVAEQGAEQGAELWLTSPRPAGAAGLADARLRAAALGATVPPPQAPSPARATVVAAALSHGWRTADSAPTRSTTALRVWGASAVGDGAHQVAPHPALRDHRRDRPRDHRRDHGRDHRDEPDAVQRLRAMAEVAALDWPTFSRRAAALTDDRFGLLGRPDEGDLTQLPIPVSTVAVSDPFGHLGGPFRLADGDLDFDRARYRTVLRGLAGYAGLAVDPRRVAGGRVTGVALGTGPDLATSLSGATPVVLAAERVFPVLAGADPAADPADYRPPAGTAAGLDLASALTGAAAAYVRDLTLAEGSGATVTEVDLGAPTGPDVRQAVALLRAVRRDLRVRRVRGRLGVPVLLAAFGERPVAAAAGPGALAEVLRLALLADQSARTGEDAYAPRLTLPATLPAPTADRDADDGPDPLTALTAAHRVLVVPLDHDPAVSSWLPSLLRVMIDD